METAWITCPTCFESFEIAIPPPEEMPTVVDYDCEICCRPMIVVFEEGNCHARGLSD